MINSTKFVIQMISTQQVNPDYQVRDWAPDVESNFKVIIMCVLGRLILFSVNGFLKYIWVDDFLEREYKEDYKQWKDKNFLY